jgi:hypothetical protein
MAQQCSVSQSVANLVKTVKVLTASGTSKTNKVVIKSGETTSLCCVSNWPAHALIGNLDESQSNLFGGVRRVRLLIDFGIQLRKLLSDDLRIERLVSTWPEY